MASSCNMIQFVKNVEVKQGKDGYDPLGEQEIARVMGISQQRVNQVVVNLLGASNFTSDKNKVREAIRLFLQDDRECPGRAVQMRRCQEKLNKKKSLEVVTHG